MKTMTVALGFAMTVLVTSLPATHLSRADDELQRKQEIWDQADDDLMRYMKESVAFVADGHRKAYDAYSVWYINVHEPAQHYTPPIEIMLRYVFENIVLLGARSLIPYKGVFAVDLLTKFADDGYKEISTSLRSVNSAAGLKAVMDLEYDSFKQRIMSLPVQFENDYPSQFEDAMYVYLEEELETPGIHVNSQFGIGQNTREYLRVLGFPEPSYNTVSEVAEAILAPMVHQTLLRTYSDSAAPFMNSRQFTVDAQVQARKTLYPNNPEYYCQDAWELGVFRPQECWQ